MHGAFWARARKFICGLPAILEWQGNLVTTSIKPDVLRATCAHRASLGAVWVYDPLELSGVPSARWTPLAYCSSYADARRKHKYRHQERANS